MHSKNYTDQNTSKYHYKYLIFIAVFYFMGWAVSYPVVYKLITVHGVLESASTFLFPITYAVADIITEVYGYRVARQVLWAAIICGFIFSGALEIVGHIPSHVKNSHYQSYYIVFGHVFRVYASITAASLVGNFCNIYIISRFKIIMHGKNFWLRSLLSTGIGEFIFTVIGGIMVWGGIKPWLTIILIMFNAYVFKMAYALIAVWPTALFARFLKRVEHVDTYDTGINYNPFKLTMD